MFIAEEPRRYWCKFNHMIDVRFEQVYLSWLESLSDTQKVGGPTPPTCTISFVVCSCSSYVLLKKLKRGLYLVNVVCQKVWYLTKEVPLPWFQRLMCNSLDIGLGDLVESCCVFGSIVYRLGHQLFMLIRPVQLWLELPIFCWNTLYIVP